jgi:sugar lactone lactonase YvrE
MEEVGHVLISNGPTWSLDGSKFYFVCTIEGLIKEYDYDY